MFFDYEVNPGWWWSAMLVLAKIKSTSSKAEYEEFVESFIEYIETPSYILAKSSKSKKVWYNDD